MKRYDVKFLNRASDTLGTLYDLRCESIEEAKNITPHRLCAGSHLGPETFEVLEVIELEYSESEES